MLKVTPYLWIFVLTVSIGGLWYPALGYFMVLVMLTLFVTSIYRGRWFCGNLCPRGSLFDFKVTHISRKRNIPKILSSFWVRVPVVIMLMGLMGYRVFNALMNQNAFEQIGTVLASMCLVTTILGVFMGASYSSRAWCTVCPMGTLQRWIGGDKYQLKMDKDKCIDCKLCEKACPMQLTVRDIGNNPDCIKCGKCVEACPKDALKF